MVQAKRGISGARANFRIGLPRRAKVGAAPCSSGSGRKIQWWLNEAKALDDFRKILVMKLQAVGLRIAQKTYENADLIPALLQSSSDMQLDMSQVKDTLSSIQSRFDAWDPFRTIQSGFPGVPGFTDGTILLERVTQLANIVLGLALTRTDTVAPGLSENGRVFTRPDTAAAAQWEALKVSDSSKGDVGNEAGRKHELVRIFPSTYKSRCHT